MRKSLSIALLVFLAVSSAEPVRAQADGSHPLVTDNVSLGLGFFYPDKTLRFRVDGTVPEPEIDFEEEVKFDNTETTEAFNFSWRFGEKWQIQAQYWTISDGGGATLDENIEWGDFVFREGTFARGDVGLDVARVFFGRRFSYGTGHEFGAGLGFHWLEIDASMEGQVLTSEGDSEFYRGKVGADFPMPNFGAWYIYAWSSKWALQTRVDWLSASIDKYSGGIWNMSAGVHWAVFRHFGLSLSYNYFSLDGDIKESDWHGGVELIQSGPFIGLTAYW